MKRWAVPSRLAVATGLGLATVGMVSASAAVATAPPTSPVCGGFPADVTVIVSGNGQIGIEGADAAPLDPAIPTAATTLLRGPDGTAWAQVESADDANDIVRTAPDGGSSAVASGDVRLSSTGWIGDRSAAIIIDATDTPRSSDSDSYGAVLVDYADGEQVDIGAAGGIEYGVLSMTIGPDRLAEGSFADLGEYIGFRTFDGAALDDETFSPTTDSAYAAPPFFQWPILSAPRDAAGGETPSMLSWVEGLLPGEQTDAGTDNWFLVVGASATGAESVRVDLGNPGVNLSYADFDGRYWLGTFEDASGDPDAPEPVMTPARVLVVDTAAATPTVVDAGCPIGVTASLDRLGQSPSLVSPAVAPTTTTTTTIVVPTTTTVVPTTTAPACADYTPAPDEYPLQLCQSGGAVTNVQIVLSEAGYSVDIDGYFGPGTERAVRQFQTDRGLEVDGLVGPDTWAALFGAPDFDPALDVNGNGVLDPWEIPQGD